MLTAVFVFLLGLSFVQAVATTKGHQWFLVTGGNSNLCDPGCGRLQVGSHPWSGDAPWCRYRWAYRNAAVGCLAAASLRCYCFRICSKDADWPRHSVKIREKSRSLIDRR
jgi:hypothetical protein